MQLRSLISTMNSTISTFSGEFDTNLDFTMLIVVIRWIKNVQELVVILH